MVRDLQQVTPVPFWVQPIQPLVYRESLSYLEQLHQIVRHFNEMVESLNSLKGQVQINSHDIDQLQSLVSQLETNLNQLTEFIHSGDAADVYIESLSKWIDNNLISLVGRVVKYVFFGLTDDGYFVAYIPDSWDFISWDTCMDIKSNSYGHLQLRW